MAKQTDVKINVSGLSGITPVGVTINYAVGAIPTALVELSSSGGGSKIDTFSAGVITSTDQLKRKDEVTINVDVSIYTGDGGKKNRTAKFVGYLDGLSISNAVGNNSYQAVIKNKAQTLLEITTITPGLHPVSVNIYKNPAMAIGFKQSGEESNAVKSWFNVTATQKLPFTQNVIKYYTELLKLVVDIQLNNPFQFAGKEKLPSGSQALKKVLTDPRYKKALTRAKEILDSLDLSAVESGSIAQAKASHPAALKVIQSAFVEGSNVLLENYMGFLELLGCSIIFGNSKGWVVPFNSVLKQNSGSPGKGQVQSAPNKGGPADYVSYTYNDNGYRDIAAVVIAQPTHIDGMYLGGPAFDTGLSGEYMDEKNVSQASGVLVVKSNPFMLFSPNAPYVTDSKEGKPRLDNPGDSMMKAPLKYDQAKSESQSGYKQQFEKKKGDVQKVGEVLNNYAEIKLYQNRYGDRTGTIVMDFNPQWAPGTGGSIYIRETKLTLAFYVTGVTHRIDMSSPNTGSAMTTVNFSCGRIGSSPAGVSSDKFLGYNQGKESGVQSGFLGDTR